MNTLPEFPPCLRRKEARALCRLLGITKRQFLAWCQSPPPLPEGMVFRHHPGARVTSIYSRDSIRWLAAQASHPHPINQQQPHD